MLLKKRQIRAGSSPRVLCSALMERAERVMPGGVNSPVRSFNSVGGVPRFIDSGREAFIKDVEGQRYLDFVCSWGAIILGHANPIVEEAIVNTAVKGCSFGACTELEVEFAELLIKNLRHIEMVRFVNSGTEATMTALRLARAITGRDIVVKCDGCYHGHSDSFLVQAGSGMATLSLATSAGVPSSTINLSRSVEYNDLQALERVLEETAKQQPKQQVAAVILEPLAGNMGLVLPRTDYLRGLRELCSKHGALLIFDEVMSGFRVAFGGVTEKCGVTPDIITLGKVIGGGLPVGAVAGSKRVMSFLAPSGPVYQAGTLSGNPLAMAAGLAVCNELLRDPPYQKLEELGSRFINELSSSAKKYGIPFSAACSGGMFGLFFSDRPVENYSQAKESNVALFKRFFHAMLAKGVYFPPSPYEACFLTSSHTEEDMEMALEVASSVFSQIGIN